MSAPILSIKLREVRRSRSRKVNAYVAACVTADYRAAGLWKRLRAMAEMKARYEAAFLGVEAKRQTLTGGQLAEAGRLLRAAGFESVSSLFRYELALPQQTYFGDGAGKEVHAEGESEAL